MKLIVKGKAYYPIATVEFAEHKLQNEVNRYRTLESECLAQKDFSGAVEMDEKAQEVEATLERLIESKGYYFGQYEDYKTCKGIIEAYKLRNSL